jgi:hypothetical protein
METPTKEGGHVGPLPRMGCRALGHLPNSIITVGRRRHVYHTPALLWVRRSRLGGFASAVLDWHLRMLRLHLGGPALVSVASVHAASSAGTSVYFGGTSEDWPWFRSHQLMHPLRLAPPYASVAPRRAGLGFGHISQCTSICFGGTSAGRPWFRSPQLRIQHGGGTAPPLLSPSPSAKVRFTLGPPAPRRSRVGFGWATLDNSVVILP